MNSTIKASIHTLIIFMVAGVIAAVISKGDGFEQIFFPILIGFALHQSLYNYHEARKN